MHISKINLTNIDIQQEMVKQAVYCELTADYHNTFFNMNREQVKIACEILNVSSDQLAKELGLVSLCQSVSQRTSTVTAIAIEGLLRRKNLWETYKEKDWFGMLSERNQEGLTRLGLFELGFVYQLVKHPKFYFSGACNLGKKSKVEILEHIESFLTHSKNESSSSPKLKVKFDPNNFKNMPEEIKKWIFDMEKIYPVSALRSIPIKASLEEIKQAWRSDAYTLVGIGEEIINLAHPYSR